VIEHVGYSSQTREEHHGSRSHPAMAAEKPAKLKVPIVTLKGDTREFELDPSEKLEFLTFKIAQALQMTPGRVSVICDDKVWTEPEIQLKDFWKEGCTLTMLETPAWGVARLETLKAKFLKHGKLEKEADGCRRHDAELPDGLALPSILVELMICSTLRCLCSQTRLTWISSAMRTVAMIGGKSMVMTTVQTRGGFALGSPLSMTTTTSMPRRIHQISGKSGTS